MAKQGDSSVLDALNSGDELSSDNNESDECGSTNDIKITEERMEHGGTATVSKGMNLPLAVHSPFLV